MLNAEWSEGERAMKIKKPKRRDKNKPEERINRQKIEADHVTQCSFANKLHNLN